MAVEEPVARRMWGPGHRHGRSASHQLGDDGALRSLRVDRVAHRIAARVHSVVKAVQMQWVSPARRVDEAPLNRVSYRVRVPLRMRPGATVEDQSLFAMLDWRAERGFVPSPQ